jgi:hypothetical protein
MNKLRQYFDGIRADFLKGKIARTEMRIRKLESFIIYDGVTNLAFDLGYEEHDSPIERAYSFLNFKLKSYHTKLLQLENAD